MKNTNKPVTKKEKTVKNTAKKTKMGKIELIAKVAKDLDIPQKEVSAVINRAIDEAAEQLKKGNSVAIMDFGSFKIQKVKARKGRNIHTGEELEIPAHKRVKFTTGKKLADDIYKKK